ncbi:MAG: hypothetical protein R3B55_03615 [Candidatus Paceibacterota bacterium]
MSASEINPNEVETISMSVKGNTEIIWEIDQEAIKDVLVGIKERSFQSVIGEFKSIEKAEHNQTDLEDKCPRRYRKNRNN